MKISVFGWIPVAQKSRSAGRRSPSPRLQSHAPPRRDARRARLPGGGNRPTARRGPARRPSVSEGDTPGSGRSACSRRMTSKPIRRKASTISSPSCPAPEDGRAARTPGGDEFPQGLRLGHAPQGEDVGTPGLPDLRRDAGTGARGDHQAQERDRLAGTIRPAAVDLPAGEIDAGDFVFQPQGPAGNAAPTPPARAGPWRRNPRGTATAARRWRPPDGGSGPPR